MAKQMQQNVNRLTGGIQFSQLHAAHLCVFLHSLNMAFSLDSSKYIIRWLFIYGLMGNLFIKTRKYFGFVLRYILNIKQNSTNLTWHFNTPPRYKFASLGFSGGFFGVRSWAAAHG